MSRPLTSRARRREAVNAKHHKSTGIGTEHRLAGRPANTRHGALYQGRFTIGQGHGIHRVGMVHFSV